MLKTNAMRLLDAANIDYEAREYEVDEHDLSGVHAAKTCGMPPEMMFKTLVARGDKNGICVFCIPVAEELDLKRAASLSGNKKIEMLPLKELLSVTGYVRGGCSPVGMKKKYPTFIDETCILFDRIAISAGRRGLQMMVAPDNLADYTNARIEALTVG